MRTRGNQRRYARDVLRRIAIIKVAQRAGIPLATIRQALTAFKDQTAWQTLARNSMGKDFSWTNSAREYVRIYEKSRQLRTVHSVDAVSV